MFVCFEWLLPKSFITNKDEKGADEAEWTGLSMMAPETQPFSYDGFKVKGQVVEVLEGDTVQVVILFEDNYQSHRFRLSGLNAPDLFPKKDSPTYQEEKELAMASRQVLIDKLKEDNMFVMVEFEKDDRYGRRVGTLTTRKGENINEWMTEHGYAIPCDVNSYKRLKTTFVEKLDEPVKQEEKKEEVPVIVEIVESQ